MVPEDAVNLTLPQTSGFVSSRRTFESEKNVASIAITSDCMNQVASI